MLAVHFKIDIAITETRGGAAIREADSRPNGSRQLSLPVPTRTSNKQIVTWSEGGGPPIARLGRARVDSRKDRLDILGVTWKHASRGHIRQGGER
jgi:hypothetical protein